MCGLYFFIHVGKNIIVVAKKFIVVVKKTTLSSIDRCNQNWMTLFTLFTFSMKIILVVSCNYIYN